MQPTDLNQAVDSSQVVGPHVEVNVCDKIKLSCNITKGASITKYSYCKIYQSDITSVLIIKAHVLSSRGAKVCFDSNTPVGCFSSKSVVQRLTGHVLRAMT